jgi:hypothetical protein
MDDHYIEKVLFHKSGKVISIDVCFCEAEFRYPYRITSTYIEPLSTKGVYLEHFQPCIDLYNKAKQLYNR